jgi:hypothetical protein
MFSYAKNNNFNWGFINEYEDVSLDVTSINLPSISRDVSEIKNNGLSYNLSNTEFIFEELTMVFLLDSEFKNWRIFYDWLLSQYDPYEGKRTGWKRVDGILSILDNGNKPIFHLMFEDLVPTTLSDVTFNTTSTDKVECSVTFKYQFYKFIEEK